MDAQLKKGFLEICVLSAIEEEPSYGYKIISDLAPHVQISESTLYPILRRLEKSGAVKTEASVFNGRLRRYFSITETGSKKLEEFMETMEQFEKIKDFLMRGKKDEI